MVGRPMALTDSKRLLQRRLDELASGCDGIRDGRAFGQFRRHGRGESASGPVCMAGMHPLSMQLREMRSVIKQVRHMLFPFAVTTLDDDIRGTAIAKVLGGLPPILHPSNRPA